MEEDKGPVEKPHFTKLVVEGKTIEELKTYGLREDIKVFLLNDEEKELELQALFKGNATVKLFAIKQQDGHIKLETRKTFVNHRADLNQALYLNECRNIRLLQGELTNTNTEGLSPQVKGTIDHIQATSIDDENKAIISPFIRAVHIIANINDVNEQMNEVTKFFHDTGIYVNDIKKSNIINGTFIDYGGFSQNEPSDDSTSTHVFSDANVNDKDTNATIVTLLEYGCGNTFGVWTKKVVDNNTAPLSLNEFRELLVDQINNGVNTSPYLNMILDKCNRQQPENREPLDLLVTQKSFESLVCEEDQVGIGEVQTTFAKPHPTSSFSDRYF